MSPNLFALLLWSGGPGERADPACRRRAAGQPEEDHNTLHDQIWEGQSAWDTSSTDSVSVFMCLWTNTLVLVVWSQRPVFRSGFWPFDSCLVTCLHSLLVCLLYYGNVWWTWKSCVWDSFLNFFCFYLCLLLFCLQSWVLVWLITASKGFTDKDK